MEWLYHRCLQVLVIVGFQVSRNEINQVCEQRLLPVIVGVVPFPIELFWFAWTAATPTSTGSYMHYRPLSKCGHHTYISTQLFHRRLLCCSSLMHRRRYIPTIIL